MSDAKSLTTWQGFQTELQTREAEIAAMLPHHVSKDRFLSSAIAAVKQNPDLLKCSPRSLFGAITKSAQDGLLPDAREGVITPFKGEAQWNPMTFGLRKRARDIDGIIVDAQVVHKADKFERVQGDEPSLIHIPAPMGTERGPMIGAYAIFKKADEGILHREVMDAAQIALVHGQVIAKNSLMWTKFVEEAWKKTVVRRGFKSVPCSEKLQQIVTRDDDQFAFDEPTPLPPPAPPAAPPASAKAIEGEIVPPKAKTEPRFPPKAAKEPEKAKAWEPEFPGYGDMPKFFEWVDAMLGTVSIDMGIDALEMFYNVKIQPRLEGFDQLDSDQVLWLYEQQQRRFEPA